ncbi:MAG: TRAP transporter fused permease subunit [Alphaproteobacteria bacterium]|nr:MAG: TRAP transporter fused permease subunit [Alphaproteobacteria bacterium]
MERVTFLTERGITNAAFETVLNWLAVAFALFHVWANTFGNPPELTLAALHWGGFAFFCAVGVPVLKGRARGSFFVDLVLGMLAFALAVYAVVSLEALYARGVHFTTLDWVASCLGILLALEMVRRTAGWFIPVLALIGLTYVFWWGDLVGGLFHFPGLTLETTLFRAFFETSGMFGSIARISSTYVFMFILFGAFLLHSGAGEFVVSLARVLAKRMTGGPGLVAVMGSALTGTVSGSAVANTVSTGSITIPLMMRAGYAPRFAAAVEAAASTGGQLMPPIMGAGAFIMASYTQVSYLTIVAVSVLPAILYFLSVGFWVRIEAKRAAIEPEGDSAETDLWRRSASFVIPIGIIILLLVIGFTPTYAAAVGIVAVIASSWLTPMPMKFADVIEALALGVKNMTATAVLLVGVGLVVMVISATGLGNTISLLMTDWAGGSLILALVLVALASLVLGMGLPVTASYIVLATLSAPALYDLMLTSALVDTIAQGTLTESAKALFMLVDTNAVATLSAPMSTDEAAHYLAMLPSDMRPLIMEQSFEPAILTSTLIASHMIIFWLSQDSNVTPPVCLTAFAAAAIAKSPPMSTGVTAWKIAKGLYIIPILFAYTPLLSGDWLAAVEVFVFAALGLYGLTAALAGHSERALDWPLRVTFGAFGLALLWPLPFLAHLAASAFFGLSLWLFTSTARS